jgi:hypothetical protein
MYIIDVLQMAMYPSLVWTYIFVDVWIQVQNDSHVGDEYIWYSSGVTPIGITETWINTTTGCLLTNYNLI